MERKVTFGAEAKTKEKKSTRFLLKKEENCYEVKENGKTSQKNQDFRSSLSGTKKKGDAQVPTFNAGKEDPLLILCSREGGTSSIPTREEGGS